MLVRSIKVGSTRVRVGPSQTPLDVLKQFGSQSANWASISALTVRSTVSDVIGNTGIAGMSILMASLLTIAGVSTLAVKPELAAQLKGLPLFAGNQNNDVNAAPKVLTSVASAPDVDMESRKAGNLSATTAAQNTPNQIHLGSVISKVARPVDAHQQQWVTNWLSKRYRVAGDATNMFVSTAYKTAKETKLDPLLILAVMAIESGFNPFAESPVGAQGLMQVMSKVHQEKFENFGGVKAALNPAANIKVGSLILKDYVTQGGSIEAGLKRYVGAAAFATDGGYGNRVLAEYRRLQEVAIGKNVPSTGAMTPTPALKPRQTTVATRASAVQIEAAAMPADAAADVKEHKLQQSMRPVGQMAAI